MMKRQKKSSVHPRWENLWAPVESSSKFGKHIFQHIFGGHIFESKYPYFQTHPHWWLAQDLGEVQQRKWDLNTNASFSDNRTCQPSERISSRVQQSVQGLPLMEQTWSRITKNHPHQLPPLGRRKDKYELTNMASTGNGILWIEAGRELTPTGRSPIKMLMPLLGTQSEVMYSPKKGGMS